MAGFVSVILAQLAALCCLAGTPSATSPEIGGMVDASLQRLSERPPCDAPFQECEAAYLEAIQTEARSLGEHLPAALDELANRLAPTEHEARIDEILADKVDSEAEFAEVMRLSEKEAPPRCHIALLMGVLGRQEPEIATELLMGSIPLPERSGDLCVVGGLTATGPPAYDTLLRFALEDEEPTRIWVSTMALVFQAEGTGFAPRIHSGRAEFPHTPRRMRKLAEKWAAWWKRNRTDLTWNADTRLLRFR